jgi:hypothetical protein
LFRTAALCRAGSQMLLSFAAAIAMSKTDPHIEKMELKSPEEMHGFQPDP